MQKRYYAQQVKIAAHPGKRDEIIQLLGPAINELERYPDCLYYLINVPDEPDVIWIWELWTSKKAKDALSMSPETAKTMKSLTPLVVATTDRTTMTVVDGFGL